MLSRPSPATQVAHVWGSCLAFVFSIQLITGVLLMTAYSPGDSTAWGSVYFIQYEMDFGWLIRGLHHFGSQTMVVLLGVHMLQVVIAGAICRRARSTGGSASAHGRGAGAELDRLSAAVGPEGLLGDPGRHQHRRQPCRCSAGRAEVSSAVGLRASHADALLRAARRRAAAFTLIILVVAFRPSME